MPSISYDPERYLAPPKDDTKSSDKSTDGSAFGQYQQAVNTQNASQQFGQGGVQMAGLAQQLLQPPPLITGGGMGGGGGGHRAVSAPSGPFTGKLTSSPSNWDDFYTKFLQREGIAATPQALDFMRRWNRAEGNGAAWNPWNTTQQAPGTTNFNSVGVKNFPNEDVALNAYVGLFNRNPNWYGAILNALKGTDEMAMAQAVKSSPWGTSNIMNVMR